MNQPKFKFGDKVKVKSSGKTFIITHMRSSFEDTGIQYWGESGSFSSIVFTECEIELYQEPKKKKLYAFAFYQKSIKDFYLSNFEIIS